ncbi:DMT family transporter [Crassaminicella profunda]|uniref:DMT family transporter n=1 Tax=Crassaminicella profunda TaxID=1286698 RepID=UPI001CA6C597|nr:EamA family transporter [Crassaminicella profunda]QZY55986.1 EamA family transporter [Crassaminicella profunda]
MDKKRLYILLTLTVIFWGTSFAAVKIGMGDLAPVQFLFLRTFFASVIFGVILLRIDHEKRKIEKKDIPYITYLGFMGIAGYFAVQYTALKFTTTVNASLLIGIAPIVIAIYAKFFLNEDLNLKRTIGILLCFIGICMIITKGNFSNFSFGETLFGDVLMIINAVMLAAFSLGAKKILNKYDPFIAVAYINMAACILLIPVSFIPNFLAPVSLLYSFSKIHVATVCSALYLAFTCTVLGYYAWYNAIKEIGPARTSVFNYINPLVAAIVSFFFFHEEMSIFTILGGISIIGGVSLNNMSQAKGEKVSR